MEKGIVMGDSFINNYKKRRFLKEDNFEDEIDEVLDED